MQEQRDERPANNDMIEGYKDGLDLSNPEPSGNRSHSYRHGFLVGRSDRAGKPALGGAEFARRAADDAMDADDCQGVPHG